MHVSAPDLLSTVLSSAEHTEDPQLCILHTPLEALLYFCCICLSEDPGLCILYARIMSAALSLCRAEYKWHTEGRVPLWADHRVCAEASIGCCRG